MQQPNNQIALKENLSRIFGKTWLDERNLAEQLTEEINYLINNDFNRLIFILYRVDVSEQKVRKILSENTDVSTAKQIALLLIERQLEKLEKRNTGNTSIDIPDDEKW